jgi:hypothetical protein
MIFSRDRGLGELFPLEFTPTLKQNSWSHNITTFFVVGFNRRGFSYYQRDHKGRALSADIDNY